MTKEQLRQEMRAKRLALSPEGVEGQSKRIVSSLRALRSFSEARTVLFYVSVDKEVQTTHLISSSLDEKRVCVPKVVGNAIVACEIASLDELHPGAYGVPEPLTEKKVPLTDIDLVLVPGLAFAVDGYRLGYGKGYYDMFLKDHTCMKVGLCYGLQIVLSLPRDYWDIPMDLVVTDEKVYKRPQDGGIHGPDERPP